MVYVIFPLGTWLKYSVIKLWMVNLGLTWVLTLTFPEVANADALRVQKGNVFKVACTQLQLMVTLRASVAKSLFLMRPEIRFIAELSY